MLFLRNFQICSNKKIYNTTLRRYVGSLSTPCAKRRTTSGGRQATILQQRRRSVIDTSICILLNKPPIETWWTQPKLCVLEKKFHQTDKPILKWGWKKFFLVTSEVRKCPKMRFCAVYRPPGAPYGKTLVRQKYGSCERPRRTTYQKISHLTVIQSYFFWGNVFFLTFFRFSWKYPVSV